MQENINSVQVNKINWHVPFPLTPGGWPHVDSKADAQDAPLQSVFFCMKIYPYFSDLGAKWTFILRKVAWTDTKSKTTWALLLQGEVGAWNHHIFKPPFPCGQSSTSWMNLVVATSIPKTCGDTMENSSTMKCFSCWTHEGLGLSLLYLNFPLIFFYSPETAWIEWSSRRKTGERKI